MSKYVARFELTKVIAEKFECSDAEAHRILTSLLMEMEAGLARDGILKLPRFGSFKVRGCSARPGRNPKTGTPALILESKVISFKPSIYLKKKVAGKKNL